MVGKWAVTLVARFPTVALRGRGAFAAVVGMVSAAYRSILGSAALSAAAQLAAVGYRQRSARATLAPAVTLSASGTAHGLQFYSLPLYGWDSAGYTQTAHVSAPSAKSKMFVGGLRGSTHTALTALAEGTDASALGTTGPWGETVATAIADRLFPISGAAYIAHIAAANTALLMLDCAKPSATYSAMLAQITAAKTLAGANFLSVPFIVYFGLERDQWNGVDVYTYLNAFQAAAEADIKAITGQSGTIPVLVIQPSVIQPGVAAVNPDLDHAGALLILKAHVDHPAKIILAGPTYTFVHSDAYSYRSRAMRGIGAMMARAAAALTTNGAWSPVRPTLVTRVGAVIDVDFSVPSGPLVFDTTRVMDPGDYGFTYFDDSASATISSVTLVSASKVRIVLNTTPTGANKKIRYGFNSGASATGSFGAINGPLGSPRGCLRDSSAVVDPDGYDTFNWSVIFNEPVP